MVLDTFSLGLTTVVTLQASSIGGILATRFDLAQDVTTRAREMTVCLCVGLQRDLT
jgi:hypothetical protein